MRAQEYPLGSKRTHFVPRENFRVLISPYNQLNPINLKSNLLWLFRFIQKIATGQGSWLKLTAGHRWAQLQREIQILANCCINRFNSKRFDFNKGSWKAFYLNQLSQFGLFRVFLGVILGFTIALQGPHEPIRALKAWFFT